MSFRYPRKFEAEIAAACREFEVEPSLVRGVIFAESKYRPDARSRAGACGLMQLMPQTALSTAERLGAAELATRLFDPAVNIRLGTAHLAYLTAKYALEDALAAYNAGEGNLLRWRKEGRETYGYAETRTYVCRVLRAKKIYETLRR